MRLKGSILLLLLMAWSCKSQKVQETPVRNDCFSLSEEILSGGEAIRPRVFEANLNHNCLTIGYNYSGCREGEPMMSYELDEKGKILHLNLVVIETGLCDMEILGSGSFDLFQFLNHKPKLDIYINGKDMNVEIGK